MTVANLFPEGASIQVLESIQPRRRGLGGIESLSSLITHLALHHNFAPYTLFNTVLIPNSERLSRRWKRIRWGESHLVNCYGEVAKKVGEIVSECTRNPSVLGTTFVGLGQICDPKGKHFMHQARPWCPECYLEARKLNIPAWDALYTYPRTTKICTWHHKPLIFSCWKCGLAQRFIPKFPLLDYCEHCGADLAIRNSTASFSSVEQEVLLWIANAARDMIEALNMGVTITTKNFSSTIKILMDNHFGGYEQAFARGLGLAGSNPKNWVKRGSAPSWASLVDLGYRLDVHPSQLGSAELPLTDPAYWRSRPVQTFDKPHVRPNQAKLSEIKAALDKRLKIENVTSVQMIEGLPRIAKRLGVATRTLMRHFPDECSKLISQRKSLLKLILDVREQERKARLSAAAEEIRTNGLPITTRNLKKTGKVKVSDVITGTN